MPEVIVAWWILPLFFFVAMLYASVGHGGASGYLALFALAGVATSAVVPIALMLNILVASVGFAVYQRNGYFSFRLLKPFIIGSIPAAFIGGLIPLSSQTFSLLLGLALTLAAIRMLFLREVKATSPDKTIGQNWIWPLCIGLVLGLVSGMVGIGGGIFLSPILLFLRWADAKHTAAVSSAFIVVNSVSGLAGHLSRGNVATSPMIILGACVLAGGFLGSYLGARRARPLFLQTLLGLVLLIAGGKLLLLFV
ncbi:MAG: sulfite exporter TauE/SafE family protein [Ignavibacteriae bacterium]|nr:sulfite exporter TauE/SafE family protein [Ignavibacteriota bacterium]